MRCELEEMADIGHRTKKLQMQVEFFTPRALRF